MKNFYWMSLAVAIAFQGGLPSVVAQDYYQKSSYRIADPTVHASQQMDGSMQGHGMQMPDSASGNTHSGNSHSGMAMGEMKMKVPDKPGHRYQKPAALPATPESSVPTDRPENYTGQQLTLDDLLAIATQNNPTLRQAQNQITAETGKAIQAGLYPNPGFRYSAEQIGVDGTAGEFHGGIFSQEIVRGGKLRLSRAKYVQRVKATEALALAQQFRVANDVKIHFYMVLSQQQKVNIQSELVKSSEDAAVTAREAFQMGQANAVGIRRVNVALQKSRLELLAQQNKLRQAVRQLSALVGTELDGSFFVGELEGQSIVMDFSELLAELLVSSPEMMAARAKLQADRITVRRERVEPIPNVTLEGGAGYNFERNQTVAVAGVSLRLPVWDRNQGTIQQAQADLSRQCAEIERLEGRLKRDLAGQFESYLTTTQHVDQYQTMILPELKETYRLMLESYKDNRIDWNEVLLAQNDYFTAQQEYIDWLWQWRRSQVLIDGMLLHDGLMAAEGAMPAGHIDSVAKPR